MVKYDKGDVRWMEKVNTCIDGSDQLDGGITLFRI
jgi:hypothetical protein